MSIMDTDDYQPIQTNPPVIDNSLGSLHFQLDNNDIIQDIIRVLRCQQERVDEHGRVFLVEDPNSKPLLNERGISHVLTILRSHLTKIMILSNLDEQIIKRIMEYMQRDLTDNFDDNWEEYDIQSPSSAVMIIESVTNIVYGTLCKGENGAYLRTVSTMHTIQEVAHARPQQAQQLPNNQGIIDKIRGRLTGR